MIIACVPTMPSRSAVLPRMIHSIRPQVDELQIALNVPGNDYGASARFIHCPKDGSHYYFTCDDDIEYPPDYVQKTIKEIEKRDRKAVIAWHGKSLKTWPIQNYITDMVHYQCLRALYYDVYVNIGGTGVMAFHTDTIRIFTEQFTEKNIDDVEASILIDKAGIEIVTPAHSGEWFKYLNAGCRDTIWDRSDAEGHKAKIAMVNSYSGWDL